MRALVIIETLFIQLPLFGQSSWTITEYEWRNKTTYSEYIRPEEWINKTIVFKGDTVSFDFSGIKDYEKEINYRDCKLYKPLDSIGIEDGAAFIFSHNLNKYLTDYVDELILIELKPNCYKFPFTDFIIADRKAFTSIRGVLFILTKK